MIEHDLEKIGSAVSEYSANLMVLSIKFGRKFQMGRVWTQETLAFWMYGGREGA